MQSPWEHLLRRPHEEFDLLGLRVFLGSLQVVAGSKRRAAHLVVDQGCKGGILFLHRPDCACQDNNGRSSVKQNLKTSKPADSPSSHAASYDFFQAESFRAPMIRDEIRNNPS
eukprot:765710-Hanusia_phi.AAC.2